MSKRDRAPAHPRIPSSLPVWGALCFFVSGAAGLLYEVAWSKQLSYLLGNSLHAVAAVVAAFLGGLALGARFLGPPLLARGGPTRVYAALEIGIAVLGVLSLPVLRGLEPWVGTLYRALGGEGPMFAAARIALLLAVLAPPAALMGATLPVLVTRFERNRVGPMLARLYAVNTLGAVAGTIAGGFILLPRLGLTATTWVAAGLNLIAAIVAWTRRAREPVAGEAPPAADPGADGARLPGSHRAVVAALVLVSGFVALALQIVWVRIFTLVFGSSVYSFAAVLGVYLFGLAIGSAAIAPALRRGVGLAGFGLTQLGLAYAASLQLFGFSSLPSMLYAWAERSGANWAVLFAGEIGLLALFLLVPCALLGAAFPIAAHLVQHRDSGRATGHVYAMNTVGAIAGSLVTGFVAIPSWGVQPTQTLVLALAAVAGAVAVALAYARGEVGRIQRTGAIALLAGVAILATIAPRWQPGLMSAGVFRPVQARGLGQRAEPGPGTIVERGVAAQRVLYYGEGINGSVLVGTNWDERERWLRVGGKVDAGTGRDMETQLMLGMIPAATADSGARTLVVGLGAGFTVAAARAAGAGTIDVVELEPRVVEASRYFHAAGQHPLDDPRVRLVLGDARTHLAHGADRYGLIISEPSNPWMAGVGNLFTVDFYRRVRSRLETGGVFCQWVPLYELTSPTLSSILASFLDVFPTGHAYLMGNSADLMLVAAPPSRRLAVERLQSPAARSLMQAAAITTPDIVAGYYAGPLESLRRVSAGAPLNRDDLPIVEYRAPRDLVLVGRGGTHEHPLATRGVVFHEAFPEGPLFASWSRERWFEARARLYVDVGDLAHAQVTVQAADSAGFKDLSRQVAVWSAVANARIRAVGEAESARALIESGREAEGLRALVHATELDSTNRRIWLWIADLHRQSRDFAGAELALARGRVSSDPAIQAEAALIAGMLEIDRSQPLTAALRFREVQRWSPRRVDGYLYEAAARASGGDRAGAKQVLRRGLMRMPGEADLTSLLANIEAER